MPTYSHPVVLVVVEPVDAAEYSTLYPSITSCGTDGPAASVAVVLYPHTRKVLKRVSKPDVAREVGASCHVPLLPPKAMPLDSGTKGSSCSDEQEYKHIDNATMVRMRIYIIIYIGDWYLRITGWNKKCSIRFIRIRG